MTDTGIQLWLGLLVWNSQGEGMRRVYGYSWSRGERKGVRWELLNAAPEQSYWGQFLQGNFTAYTVRIFTPGVLVTSVCREDFPTALGSTVIARETQWLWPLLLMCPYVDIPLDCMLRVNQPIFIYYYIIFIYSTFYNVSFLKKNLEGFI